MRTRAILLGLAAVVCAFPLLAQTIPAGDDVWDSLGGGATEAWLTSNEWGLLCGVDVPDTPVQLKGQNIPGYGTGDTVVARLGDADLSGGEASVAIRLKKLSFVNDGPHPCSPLSLRVTETPTQIEDTMTITRTMVNGGTFHAAVPVSALIEAVDANGNVKGSTTVNGVLEDSGTSPWSFQPPTGGVTGKKWYPGVDPVTQQPVRVCRRGGKTLPARHCYWPPPKCPTPVIIGDSTKSIGSQAIAQPEPCSIETEPVGTD